LADRGLNVVTTVGGRKRRESLEDAFNPQKTGVFHGLGDAALLGTESERAWQREFADEKKYTRRDSNPQPSVPKTDALSNCATGAWLAGE